MEAELVTVRKELIKMWMLVQSQLNKARNSIVRFDKDLAREVVLREKRVNSYELKIGLDCENILAQHSPVAEDLRFLLAVLKINSNLERMGDIAQGIGKHIIASKTKYDPALLEATRLLAIYEEALSILGDTRKAFEEEDTDLAQSIFERDEAIDQLVVQANEHIADYLKDHRDHINEVLYISSILHKLERIGDLAKNIAGEILFCAETRVNDQQD